MRNGLLSLLMVTLLSVGTHAQLSLIDFEINPVIPVQNDVPLSGENESQLSILDASIEVLNLSDVLAEEGIEVIDDVIESEESEGVFVGPLLNYPNPFSFSRETTVIGYRLSGSMDIELRLYSMTGQIIVQKSYTTANLDDETQSGYQTIEVDSDLLDGRELSPGVYFYVLISDGKLLAKEKMAVLP